MTSKEVAAIVAAAAAASLVQVEVRTLAGEPLQSADVAELAAAIGASAAMRFAGYGIVVVDLNLDDE